jgi:hypothetical protein
MLTPPTLSHLLWSLAYPLCLQLLMSSTKTPLTTRLPCWHESSVPCTSFTRIGDHSEVVLSVETPLTSSPTTPRGRSSTPPTRTTTPTGTTPVTRATTTRRRTASEIIIIIIIIIIITTTTIRRRRRNSRRSFPERVCLERLQLLE